MKKQLLFAAMILGTTLMISNSTSAQSGKWQKNHPRRAEVNKRLENQNDRVKDEVKESEMTKQKAARIHKEDKNIRKQERHYAAKHNGHITKKEQAHLNKEENKVSNQIGK